MRKKKQKAYELKQKKLCDELHNAELKKKA